MFTFLASTKLPDYKYIDMNRRNKLLLVTPDFKHAMYKSRSPGYQRIHTPELCPQAYLDLKDADHVLLSQDNNIVIPSETYVWCGNTKYSLNERFHCKILAFFSKWFVCKNEGGEKSGNQRLAFIERMGDRFGKMYTCEPGANVFVIVMGQLSGILLYIEGTQQTAKHNLYRIPFDYRTTYLVEMSQRRTLYMQHAPKAAVQDRSIIGDRMLLLLDEENIITVCCINSDSAVKKCSFGPQDLGIGEGCKILRIWAGDAEGGQSLLHVLYKQTAGQHCLASYRVTQTIPRQTCTIVWLSL